MGARINQDPEVSREFTLLGQEGSEVVQGNMLVVPIEESHPLRAAHLHAGARQERHRRLGTAIPEFKRVVVVFGNRIVMRETLAQALTAVFGNAPVVDDGGGDLPVDVTEAVAELLTRAEDAFTRADAALRAADLATFQDEVAEAQRLIAQAQALLEEALATP